MLGSIYTDFRELQEYGSKEMLCPSQSSAIGIHKGTPLEGWGRAWVPTVLESALVGHSVNLQDVIFISLEQQITLGVLGQSLKLSLGNVAVLKQKPIPTLVQLAIGPPEQKAFLWVAISFPLDTIRCEKDDVS